ncbi:MAG: pantoate--beta-alanine ligase [Saccharospirillaceae bacterium]|nr:pantoate--beta-alanine ligase [Pseudomonadales bacterium]NRB79028.1 pantoate--beta-alanine ligase [Saccharospirillaceae bacterium]
MHIFDTIETLRAHLITQKQQGKRIGFVPTMGNLHKGHLSLIKQAKAQSDVVVASIFVNPTQFSAGEDIERYPRTLEQDQNLLFEQGCDVLFIPEVQSMYPKGELTRVSVKGISSLYCGASREGHFDGVTTVVCKLFNIVQPDVAVFGSKDFQQLAIIRQMAKDLMMNIDIQAAPTFRADSGLALSSRNGYLSEEEMNIAPAIYKTLTWAKEAILNNQSQAQIEKDAKVKLTQAGLKPDYFHICNADTLQAATKEDRHIVILVAAYLGSARLIDNLNFEK